MTAFFGLTEHAAAGTHPLQKLIFLYQQQIALKLLQASFCIHIIDFRKNLLYIRIMFFDSVLVADTSVPVGSHGKGQRIIRPGREPFTEILHPGILFAVFTDDSIFPEQIQILLCKFQRYSNLNISAVFPEILRAYLIFPAYRADGIQHRGFSGIILAYENQGIFNVLNAHVVDGLKIPDIKI